MRGCDKRMMTEVMKDDGDDFFSSSVESINRAFLSLGHKSVLSLSIKSLGLNRGQSAVMTLSL